MSPLGSPRLTVGPRAEENDVTIYRVREAGKNGTVEILDDRIIRTLPKWIGRDDVQTIPIKFITGVGHDRKTMLTDEVQLTVGSILYQWKVVNAEAMVAEVHSKIF